MNNDIFYFFYNLSHQSKFFDHLVIFFAETFPYIVVLSAFLFLLFHHEVFSSPNPLKELIKKWKEFFLVFFSGGFAWLVAKILKIFFHTPRPFTVFSDVHPLFPETGFAFPSQHTVFFAAIAFAIFLSHKKAGYVFLLFALLIGLARITAGVHFPGDILGGFAIGGFVAYCVVSLKNFIS